MALLPGGCHRADERIATADAPKIIDGATDAAVPKTLNRAADAPKVIDATFDELYPIFLLHKLGEGPKARLWRRYEGQWVRWTGKLISFTENGATIKQIPGTTTFDVSLQVEPTARARLHQLKPGEEFTYVGQLQSFDDVFRTFYLAHGNLAPPR